MELLHKSPVIITQKNLLFFSYLCSFPPPPVHKSASLWFNPQFLKCALYWHLYSTFLTLPLEAFYKAMNYIPVTHWIHSCKREAVITCLAIKLIMPPTIGFLYVCTKEIKLPSCPWCSEYFIGRWAYRKSIMDQRDEVSFADGACWGETHFSMWNTLFRPVQKKNMCNKLIKG